MHWAVSSQNVETMKALLESGANPLGGSDETPVSMCVVSDFARGLEIFLDHNSALVFEEDFEGNTLLHVAAAQGNLEVAQVLVERGIDHRAVNDDEETALDIATSLSHQHLVQYLQSITK